MTEEGNSCAPGLLFYSSGEKLVRSEDLIGKKFFCFNGENDKIVVSCQDGTYSIDSDGNTQLFWQDPFSKLAAGKSFLAGIGLNNSMYTWGVQGDSGQLGHGAALKKVFEPLEIKYQAKFQEISCGESFSVALDENGFAYAWGENFDRQLGIYTKTKDKMHLANALIEEMVFSPRLIPLTMQVPMKKVVCGSRFVLALSKTGQLFSWGAGESGQLGTGRCTKREVAQEITLPNESSRPVDIAAGNAHAIAVVESGTLYAWGLNHRGQCGVGDIKARHYPERVSPATSPQERATVVYQKVIADGHSSAAIDEEGRLWTWGSMTYGRLLHPLPPEPLPNPDGMKEPRDLTMRSPKLVISDSVPPTARIDTFFFSKERSALFLKTTVMDIFPKKGPKRTFSKLTLHGYGFWETPQIIIKFTANNYSIYNPPRSCLGKYHSSTEISCKPPKFSEVGLYTVTISMDGGKEFLPQTFEVLIYKDMTILSQSPAVIDLREKYIPSLVIQASALPADVEGLDLLDVKLLFTAVPDSHEIPPLTTSSDRRGKGGDNSKTVVAEVITKGSLSFLQPPSPGVPPAESNETFPDEIPLLGEEVPATNRTAATANDESLLVIQCSDIDLSPYPALIGSNNLYELQCSVSMNGQDFAVVKDPAAVAAKGGEKDKEGSMLRSPKHAPSGSVIGNTSTVGGHETGAAAGGGSSASICHSFTPRRIAPNYYSYAKLVRLQEMIEVDRKEDEKHQSTAAYSNPFDPSNSAAQQQQLREEKYHQLFDQRIQLTGESFFLASKLPRGAHVKVSTVQIQLIPLVSRQGTASSNPPQSYVIRKEEFSPHLQELLLHCEGKTQAYFVLNYQYLSELMTYLQQYASTQQLTLDHYQWQLDYQVYLEMGSSHSSHYYNLQQHQPQQIPPLALNPSEGGAISHSQSSERILLSPETIRLVIMNEITIAATPMLLKQSIPTETEEAPVVPILLQPLDFYAFPFLSTIFQVSLQFPVVEIEGGSYAIPEYRLSSEAVNLTPIISTGTNTITEEVQSLLLNTYQTCQIKVPAYRSLLQYGYQALLNSNSQLSSVISSYSELQRYLKEVQIAIRYDNSHSNSSTSLYYYRSLENYSLQNPLPKGGAVSGTTISLVLEEYLSPKIFSNTEMMSLLVRIRGNDPTKECILPATITEVTGPSGPQSIVSFTIAEAAKIIEVGAIMSGKEKSFFMDIGWKTISPTSGEEEVQFEGVTTPLLVVK